MNLNTVLMGCRIAMLVGLLAVIASFLLLGLGTIAASLASSGTTANTTGNHPHRQPHESETLTSP
ncbi:MAG TPA: hypothetical protein VGY56_04700 [Verrucomicrobiae bacterium]|nr:hypothetical protein [Verrucomicrobiae bacterium]